MLGPVLTAPLASAARTLSSVNWPDKIAVGQQRSTKISLDGQWRFQTDPHDIGQKEGWSAGGKISQRTINVPLPWELAADDLIHYWGVAWYEKQVALPREYAGRRIALGFHGVGHHAKVFVNGHLAGEHTGAQAPFLLDITAWARPGETNTIIVRVFDPLSGTSIYMDTHSLLKVSGLWRSVWVEATGQQFVSDVFMIPDIDRGRATARVTVCVPAATENMTYTFVVNVRDPKGRRFERCGSVAAKADAKPAFFTTDLVFDLPDPCLWDLDHPNLYDVEARLRGTHGQILDTVSDTFGMRKIEAKDGRFYLNNRVFYLVGGGIDPLPYGGSGDVNWFLPGPYAYPSDEETQEDIRKIKSLGVNLVRIPLRPMHPQWLHWADRLGILVWQEESWTRFNDLSDWKNAWSECLLRDRNRPSAVLWTLFNESWGYEFADPIYEHVKSLDPTRLALDNTGGLILCQANYPGNHKKTDVEDVHNYPGFNHFQSGYWQQLRRVNPEHPLIVSEFGPIPYMFNLSKFRERWGGKDPWWVGCGRAMFAEPSKDSTLPPQWNHLGYEQRYREWGMEQLFGTWDRFIETHDRYYFWGLKCQTQWMRMNNELAGFVAWIWDNGQHGTGAIDNFKQVKVFGPELARIWTQDLVILDNPRHNFWPGETLYAHVHVSHFSQAELAGARIEWSLELGGPKGRLPLIPVPTGQSRLAGEIVLTVPQVTDAAMGRLSARLVDRQGKCLSENWEPVWLFPQAWRRPSPLSFAVAGGINSQPLALLGYSIVPLDQKPRAVVTSVIDKKVGDYLAAGGTAILYAVGPSELLTRNKLQIEGGMLGGHTDSFYARKGTGIFDRIPYENPYIWQFHRIWPKATIHGMRPADHGDILAGGYMNLLNRQCATMAQFRYGRGRLILSTHDLPGAVHDDPAAMIIFNDLLHYATGDFRPRATLGQSW